MDPVGHPIMQTGSLHACKLRQLADGHETTPAGQRPGIPIMRIATGFDAIITARAAMKIDHHGLAAHCSDGFEQ